MDLRGQFLVIGSGIVGLRAALTLAESGNVTMGLMVARAALRREESRGGRFRSDFPNRDDIKWQKHIADRLEP